MKHLIVLWKVALPIAIGAFTGFLLPQTAQVNFSPYAWLPWFLYFFLVPFGIIKIHALFLKDPYDRRKAESFVVLFFLFGAPVLMVVTCIEMICWRRDIITTGEFATKLIAHFIAFGVLTIEASFKEKELPVSSTRSQLLEGNTKN